MYVCMREGARPHIIMMHSLCVWNIVGESKNMFLSCVQFVVFVLTVVVSQMKVSILTLCLTLVSYYPPFYGSTTAQISWQPDRQTFQ